MVAGHQHQLVPDGPGHGQVVLAQGPVGQLPDHRSGLHAEQEGPQHLGQVAEQLGHGVETGAAWPTAARRAAGPRGPESRGRSARPGRPSALLPGAGPLRPILGGQDAVMVPASFSSSGFQSSRVRSAHSRGVTRPDA